MRKTIATLAAFALLASIAGAQVVAFGQGVTITGTTNVPAVGTNAPTVVVKQIALTIASANSTTITGFTGNVWLTTNPTNVPTLGNSLLVGSVTYTNATNATFTGYSTNVPVYVVLQAVCGTNSVNLSEIYGGGQ